MNQTEAFFSASRPVLRAFLVICVYASFAQPTSQIRAIGPVRNICGIYAPNNLGDSLGLIIWFHGGMNSLRQDKGKSAYRMIMGYIDTTKYILASPSAFQGQGWLTARALDNIKALTSYLLTTYPIKKGDINLAGVSDGCLAVTAYSLNASHPINRRLLFSSWLKPVINLKDLNNYPLVKTGTWHFFQGGRDRLYPAIHTKPFLYTWKQQYPNVNVYWFEDGEHDFSYYANNCGGLIRGILKRH